jgi:hypothetical protein
MGTIGVTTESWVVNADISACLRRTPFCNWFYASLTMLGLIEQLHAVSEPSVERFIVEGNAHSEADMAQNVIQFASYYRLHGRASEGAERLLKIAASPSDAQSVRARIAFSHLPFCCAIYLNKSYAHIG